MLTKFKVSKKKIVVIFMVLIFIKTNIIVSRCQISDKLLKSWHVNTLKFHSLEALVIFLFTRWNPFTSSVSHSEQLSNNKTEASFHIK